jgi:multicomponent Na+:H+ antiporter subunit G
MEMFLNAMSWAFLLTGCAFCVIGGIGLVRMPDFYTRSHAAGLTDTLGAALILLGLGIQAGISLIAIKLLFIYMFLYITSPTSAHALVKAAYSKGLKAPHVEDLRDPTNLDAAIKGQGS